VGEYETIDDWDYSYDDSPRVYNRRTRVMRTARTTNERENMSESTATTGTRTARRGFGGYNKAADGVNRTTFQVQDDSEIIVFLEPENFSYALRHWIKYVDESGNQVTRAEWCLEEECPMCDIGDRPKPVAFFNVVDLASPSKVLVWEASADPTKAIQKEFNKLVKRNQNLSDDGLYWVISREKGRNGFYTYSVDKLPEDDLLAEWPSLKPLAPAQRDALRHRAYDESYVEYKDRGDLQEFVDSLG
jgi:hypothetical protein